MSGTTTPELIRDAVNGDRTALERLLVLHHDRVVASIQRRMPTVNTGAVTAEDIAQEAYVVAFRRIGQFEPQGDDAFFRWLSKIAEHRLFDALKAMRAVKRGSGRAPVQSPAGESSQTIALLGLLAVDERTPSVSVAGREAAPAVQKALLELKEDYRDVLRMRYVEGLSIAEVASRMNRTEGAINMLCQRALRAMADLLGSSSKYFSRK